ncbi:hypothetical protein C0991_002650, partial [Blastosporella zonata]
VASHRVGAADVGPDQGTTGSGVGQRLIPVEPMSIVLNIGISPNWQTIDTSTLIFPLEMLIDYVKVYQRKGQTNVGCDPPSFPTMDHINNRMDAYTSESSVSTLTLSFADDAMFRSQHDDLELGQAQK